MFFSGRPHVRDESKGYFTAAIMIAVTPTIRDIGRYLEMMLDRRGWWRTAGAAGDCEGWPGHTSDVS